MTPNLNVRCDYPRHPKTQRLKALLGPEADIYPIRLWAWCGEFSERNGDFPGHTPAEIEAFAGWTGGAGKLIETLEKVGYMERKRDVWRCADWTDHQGHIYGMKVRAQRANDARWKDLRALKAASNKTPKGQVKESSNQPDCTNHPDQPRRSGGGRGTIPRGSGGRRTLGQAAPAGWSGRFQWPGPLEVFVPLHHAKAEAMIADAEAIEAEIKRTGPEQQGAKDALGESVPTLSAEAKAALKAWRQRKLDVRKARTA